MGIFFPQSFPGGNENIGRTHNNHALHRDVATMSSLDVTEKGKEFLATQLNLISKSIPKGCFFIPQILTL